MPSSAFELLLIAIRDLLIERGIAVAKPSDSFVALAKLPLDIHVHDVTILQESAKLNAISAVFDARARGATENGVCVLAMGYGDNAEACAREAARQWVTGVFPVIQSWLTRAEHAATVTKSEMIVSVAETSQQFGWSVHLGPILYRVYGPPSRKYAPPEVDSNDVLQAVLNAVHPFAHTTPSSGWSVSPRGIRMARSTPQLAFIAKIGPKERPLFSHGQRSGRTPRVAY